MKTLLKMQKDELYKLHKLISENCYYIYSIEDVETQKILMLDVIESPAANFFFVFTCIKLV